MKVIRVKRKKRKLRLNSLTCNLKKSVSKEVLNLLEQIITKLKGYALDGVKIEEIIEEYHKSQITLKLTPDFQYYVLLCSLFDSQEKRFILNLWQKYHSALMKLVKSENEKGIVHLLQAIGKYYYTQEENVQKSAPSLLKMLYDKDVFEEDFLIQWHSKEIKLDKKCVLYDRKADKRLRKLSTVFIEWLK